MLVADMPVLKVNMGEGTFQYRGVTYTLYCYPGDMFEFLATGHYNVRKSPKPQLYAATLDEVATVLAAVKMAELTMSEFDKMLEALEREKERC